MKLKYAVVPLIVLIGCTTDPAKFRLGGESEDVGRVAEGIKPNCGSTDTIGTNRVTGCEDPSIINNSSLCNASYAPWHQSGAWNQSTWVQCEWHPMGGSHASCEPKKELPCVPHIYPRNQAITYAGTVDAGCNANYSSNETQCNLGLISIDSGASWHNCRWLGSTCKGAPVGHTSTGVAGTTTPEGGIVGNAFSDAHDIDVAGRITRIDVAYSSTVIYGIGVTYADNSSTQHGDMTNGTTASYVFDKNEVPNRVDVWTDNWSINGLQIFTDVTSYGPVGDTGYTYHNETAGSYFMLSLKGREYSNHLVNLYFDYGVKPVLKPTQ
jgi:hypothetical protein